MIIPENIKVYLMYRDASNYKNGDYYLFTNKSKIGKKIIANALKKLEDLESFIPSYYGITNHPAPYDNEFIECPGDDHSFIELHAYTAKYDPDVISDCKDPGCDISTVVYAVKHPKLVEGRQRDAQKEAKQILQKQIESL